jgi:hypothetical protein
MFIKPLTAVMAPAMVALVMAGCGGDSNGVLPDAAGGLDVDASQSGDPDASQTADPDASPGVDDGGPPDAGDEPEAELVIEPANHDFGAVSLGETSAPADFSIVNHGDTDTGALVVAVDNDLFAVVDEDCTDAVLEPDEACTVTVAFAPTQEGSVSAALSVSANPGGSITAALEGEGIAAAVVASLSIAPVEHDFAAVVVGSSSDPESFTVTNDGDAASSPISVAIDGDEAFVVIADGCTDVELAAGDDCTIEVAFEPSEEGVATATLQVSATEGGAATSELSGEGQVVLDPEIVITAGIGAFPPTDTQETSESQTLTIQNVGGSATGVVSIDIVGGNATSFAIVSVGAACDNSPLEAGESCDIEVVFSPAPGAPGPRSSTLEISAEPGGTVTASLEGNATT